MHNTNLMKLAYLDIETTGLSPRHSELTVVGVALFEGLDLRVEQLWGPAITSEALEALLADVDHLFTYNGRRFDIPFIERSLRISLRHIPHRDLMYDCWRHDLKGGLKAVERRIGISRALPDMNGYMAVQLWWDYVNHHNQAALDRLLAYNREDVVNLHTLRQRLGVRHSNFE